MAKNHRRSNRGTDAANKAEEIKEIEAVEEAEEIAEEIEAVEEAAEIAEKIEAVEEAAEIAEEIEAVEEAEEIAEEIEAVEEAEEIVEEIEAVEEAEEIAEEIEAVEEAEEVAEEIEAVEEAEEIAEEIEAVEETEEVAEDIEAVEEAEEVAEEIEAIEEAEEVAEEIEAIEEADEEAEEVAEEIEAVEEADEEAEEIEAVEEAEEIAEEIEAVEETEEVAEDIEADEEAEESDESEDDEESEDEESEEEDDEDNGEGFAEEVDEDDYLDYDDDETRPKKIVSGKAAVITMLATLVGSILVIVGAFLFASRFQRSMSVSVVSFTDRFNSCDTNSFSYGSVLGVDAVSFSDAESTLSEQDVRDLKSGKTVTKFNGMVNIDAKTRLGKLVSMDITFNPAINETDNPAGYYTLLAGNVMSGLIPNINTSDYGFMLAFTVLSYSIPVEGQDNLYQYQVDDMTFYVDYSKAMESEGLEDIAIHVENAEPHYLDTSKVDTSWLPWNKDVSDSDTDANDDIIVSVSDN